MDHLANMMSGYGRAEAPGEAYAYNDVAIQLYGESIAGVFGEELESVAERVFSPLQFEDGGLLRVSGGLRCRGVHSGPLSRGLVVAKPGSLGRCSGDSPVLLRCLCAIPGAVDFPLSSEDGVDYLSVGSFGGGTNQIDYGPGVYGYTWWHNLPAEGAPEPLGWSTAPPDLYFAAGHWGREAIVVAPSWDLVVAWRTDRGRGARDMQPFTSGSRSLRFLGPLAPLERWIDRLLPCQIDQPTHQAMKQNLTVNQPGEGQGLGEGEAKKTEESGEHPFSKADAVHGDGDHHDDEGQRHDQGDSRESPEAAPGSDPPGSERAPRCLGGGSTGPDLRGASGPFL